VVEATSRETDSISDELPFLDFAIHPTAGIFGETGSPPLDEWQGVKPVESA